MNIIYKDSFISERKEAQRELVKEMDIINKLVQDNDEVSINLFLFSQNNKRIKEYEKIQAEIEEYENM